MLHKRERKRLHEIPTLSRAKLRRILDDDTRSRALKCTAYTELLRRKGRS